MPYANDKRPAVLLAVAVLTLALSVPPVAVPWAAGHFHLEPYDHYEPSYDGPAHLTLWGIFGTGVPSEAYTDTVTISVRYSKLPGNYFDALPDRPCQSVELYYNSESTPLSTIQARARASQAMVIITIISAVVNVVIAVLRLMGALPRRIAVIATVVSSFVGLAAAIGAIIAWSLLFRSCGTVNVCEMLTQIAVESVVDRAFERKGDGRGATCLVSAGLPLLALAMVGFIVTIVLTLVFAKDKQDATNAERTRIAAVNTSVYSDTESELEETADGGPISGGGFVPPPAVPHAEKRPDAEADYTADDNPYAADYA